MTDNDWNLAFELLRCGLASAPLDAQSKAIVARMQEEIARLRNDRDAALLEARETIKELREDFRDVQAHRDRLQRNIELRSRLLSVIDGVRAALE